MTKAVKTLILIIAAASMSACTGLNVFKDSSEPSPTVAANQGLAPPANVNSVLTADQIRTLLTGKSWRWESPKNKGVTLYASDGTSLVEVTGKGTTGGKWTAKDGLLCESFSPAPFIPQGVPMTCQPFTGTAGNYRVGQASFALAS
jgi:hypothetical protein